MSQAIIPAHASTALAQEQAYTGSVTSIVPEQETEVSYVPNPDYVEFITDKAPAFEPNRSGKVRREAAIAVGTYALARPQDIGNFYRDMTYLISETDPEAENNIIKLKTQSIANLPLAVGSLSDTAFEALCNRTDDLLPLALDRTYRDVGEAVLNGVVERLCSKNDTKNVAKLAHDLAVSALKADDMEAIEYVTRILTYKTPIAQGKRTKFEALLRTAAFDVTDEDTLMYGIGIEMFANTMSYHFYGTHAPMSFSRLELARAHMSRISKLGQMGKFGPPKERAAAGLEFTRRNQKLQDFWTAVSRNPAGDTFFGFVPEELHEEWPLTLLWGPDSLLTLTEEFTTNHSPQTVLEMGEVTYTIPGSKRQRALRTAENATSIKEEFLNALDTEPYLVQSIDAIRTFVDFVHPPFPEDPISEKRDALLDQLANESEKLRTQLHNLPQRNLPSSRALIVMNEPAFDAELTALNVKAVSFSKMPTGEITVELLIGQSRVAFKLNEYRHLSDIENGKPLGRVPVRANLLNALWWEVKVLNMLSAFVCADPDKKLSTVEATARRDGILARVGHRRRLFRGEKIGAEQYELARTEGFGDLRAINAAFHALGLPPGTYVREVIKDVPEGTVLDPLVFYPEA